MSKLRLSSCGSLFWDADNLVWDDYLAHRQFALASGMESVMRFFTAWRERDEARTIRHEPWDTDTVDQIVTLLLDSNILIAHGSSRHRQEDGILDTWGQWGALARSFHYCTRTSARTSFLSGDDQNRILQERLRIHPPPLAYRRIEGAYRVGLPRGRDVEYKTRDLIDVLRGRRSHRSFGDEPVPLESLSVILETAAGIVKLDDITQTAFKTSPSGGARHPTELYLYARNITDLPAGVYHYNALDHELERIRGKLGDADLVYACGDQQWAGDGAVVLIYTSIIARNIWKYHIPRSYRILHMDVGHLNQTVYLLATALGLRMTFTGAVRDDVIEEILEIDLANELVMGCAIIGAGGSGDREVSAATLRDGSGG